MHEERVPSAGPRPGRPWARRALLLVAGVAWLAVAGVALRFRQQGLDDENGVPPRPFFSLPAPKPAPTAKKPPPERLFEPGMTPRQYNHLQKLPPYGVVKPASERAAASRARDGGL